jgi:ubiquinone/menaquinone biosynthesis C-methylase UbiE
MIIEIKADIEGSILDVGGGGEGVIGQIYGEKVLAIDHLQEELDEALDCCEKQLMDATELSFANHSFDNATFFYTLMYMTRETQEKAIREAARVLKPGGKIYIWDADIQSAYPDPYVVDLVILSEQKTIRTSYGIVKNETQNCDSVIQFLESNGLIVEYTHKKEGQFFIVSQKA